jgi:hypothetical protein
MSVEMLTFTSGVVFWEQYNSRQVPLDLDFQANTLLCVPSIPSLRTSLYCLTVLNNNKVGN